MKIIQSAVLLLALGAASSLAFGQDRARFMVTLDGKTRQMNQCADVAKKLEAIPLPVNVAQERLAAAGRTIIAGSAAADPQFVAFESAVMRMDGDLRACGTDLFKDLKTVDDQVKPFLDALMKQTNLTDADKKAVVTSVGAYQKAKVDLQAAVQLLSKDIQVQSYVSKTLTEVYLSQKY